MAILDENPDQGFDYSGIPFPGFLRRIPCPSAPTGGSTPDQPTGEVQERMMIAALRRLSADGHSLNWRMLAAETGSDWPEIDRAISSLVAREIVDR